MLEMSSREIFVGTTLVGRFGRDVGQHAAGRDPIIGRDRTWRLRIRRFWLRTNGVSTNGVTAVDGFEQVLQTHV